MKCLSRISKTVILLLALVILTPISAWSEDIDLFAGTTPSTNTPTLLLVWDTAARTSADVTNVCDYSDDPDLVTFLGHSLPQLGEDTAAGMEQCAMVKALWGLLKEQPQALSQIRVGLMIYNKNKFSSDYISAADNSGQCGFLAFEPTQMDTTTGGPAEELIKLIAGFDKNILANSSKLGDTMAEAWQMLNSYDGSDGQKTCSGANYSTLSDVATQCRDAVLMFIGNAFTNSNPTDGGQNPGAPELLKDYELAGESYFGYETSSDQYQLFSEPIAVSLLNTSGNDNNNYWADEWARFMKRVNVDDNADVNNNITTYTVSVTDFANKDQAQPIINYYSMMAKQGAGKSFLVDVNDSSALVDALLDVFNEIQAVNSVFSSATLPVSANTQGTFLNQIYIAMFRPDANSGPRWLGNLKQYRLGFDAGGNLVLTDSKPENDPIDNQGNRRVVESITNPITGTVTPDARSFWTTNAPTGVSEWPVDGYWFNAPAGEGLAKDGPDGDLVEKGGAGQMLRAYNLIDTYSDSSTDNSRKLLTCNTAADCSANPSLREFSVGNTYLTSNAQTLFGITPTSSSAVLTAGATATLSVTIDCDKDFCFMTFDSGSDGGLNFEPGDWLFLPGESAFNCLESDTTTPCVVEQAGGSVVQFVNTQSGTPSSITGKTVEVKRASRVVSVAYTGHGLIEGEGFTVSNCTDSADGNLSTTDIEQQESVLVVPDSNNFLFSLSNPIYLDSAVGSTCTVASLLTAENLINFVRGEDIAGNEDPLGPCDGVENCDITVRPSVHGDVLHSRPAVINYGTDTNGDDIGVVVFYGANDGVFHAINGNQETSIEGVPPGGELWGFIAPEFFGKFKRYFRDDPRVKISGIVDDNASPKDYFFDGSPTSLQDERTGVATSGRKFLFMTARRGGRLVYALEVTDINDPEYLWSFNEIKIPELGQTWSQPRVGLVEGYVDANGEPKPVLIMGMGYDPAEDADPGPGADTLPATSDANYPFTMGRGVLVLDALTGEIVWAAMPDCSSLTQPKVTNGLCVDTDTVGQDVPTRAIAAETTLLDRNNDGLVDRAYFTDTGANIWRMDFGVPGAADISDWSIYKLAQLGGTGNDMRKFLFPVDVIPASNNFDVVVAVSGDREHPLVPDANFDGVADSDAGLAYNVQNRFYAIQDDGTANIVESQLYDNPQGQCFDTDDADGSRPVGSTDPELVSCTDSTADTEVNFAQLRGGKKGYFIDLENTGEKGINAPLTVAGKVFFGTNQPEVPDPDSGSCNADLGVARAYEIDFRGAKVTSRLFSGGGMPPSPIAGLVTIGEDTVPFVIGGQGPSPFDPGEPVIDLSNKRNRAYWYFE